MTIESNLRKVKNRAHAQFRNLRVQKISEFLLFFSDSQQITITCARSCQIELSMYYNILLDFIRHLYCLEIASQIVLYFIV